jgi:putative exporter of polyketide antibiotics
MLLAWLLGSGVLAVFMVGIGRSAVDNLLSSAPIREELARGGTDPYRAFVAIFWFGVAQLVLAGFAIHLVSGWAAEDGSGVLEALLSRPRSRWSIVVERAAAALAAVALVIAVDSLLVLLTADRIGIDLDLASVFRASWLLVPFCLTFAAAGAVGSSWRPRATVGLLAGLAVLSYFAWELGPILNWPTWVRRLSVFQLYGTPLTGGIFWGGLWAMLAVVLAGFALAAGLMQRREIGR